MAGLKPQTDVVDQNKQDAGVNTLPAEAAMIKKEAALKPEETPEAGASPKKAIEQKDAAQLENSDLNSK